jgi:hypothetical protein
MLGKPSFDINHQGLGLSHCELDYEIILIMEMWLRSI